MSLDGAHSGGVLALDLAGTVGVAYGHIGQRNPLFTFWRLPHIGGEGMRYAALENLLSRAMELLEPTDLVIEKHLPIPAMNNVAAMRQAMSLRAIALTQCYHWSCAPHEIDSLTVRREVMGMGRYSKDTVKREVVAFCHKRGLKVPNHDSADACLLWLWNNQRMTGGRPVAGPLFAGEY